MKNILSKFKINTFTYYLFITCFICGYIKNAIILFILVLIHEIGHVLAIKICKYKIISINIYPFGGITKIEKLINGNLIYDLVISICGVLFQYLVVKLLVNTFTFNNSTLNLINSYNKIIIIFNLLPIIPLDGSKILQCILELFISYKTSYYLTIIISFLFIFLFINYSFIYSVNNYLIVMVLIYNTYLSIKTFKYMFNRFLLERILYNLKYNKIVNNTKKIDNLCKNKYHFFNYDKKVVSESKKIKKMFDKNTYFWYDFNVWKAFLSTRT